VRASRLLLLAGALATARGAKLQAQQVTPAQLVEQAREQLDALAPDSAASLLRYVLDPRTGVGGRERLRGWTLLGIAELQAGRRAEAREAFREALALDAELRVDSLADLHSDLQPTFEAERAAMARASRLAVVLEIPTDTSVPLRGGGFRLTALPTRRAMLVASIATESGEELFADSLFASGVATFDWNVHRTDGRPAPAGRYVLRVSARDSSGQTAFLERALTIDLEPLDTVPLPPTLDPSLLAPESVAVRMRRTSSLWRGLAFGAGAGMLAYLGPGPSGSLDSRAWAVSLAAVAGGVVGYLSGTLTTQPNAAGVERNRQLRERDAVQRAAIQQSNDRARERVRVRIRATSRAP
jgi:hypothetical protein